MVYSESSEGDINEIPFDIIFLKLVGANANFLRKTMNIYESYTPITDAFQQFFNQTAKRH